MDLNTLNILINFYLTLILLSFILCSTATILHVKKEERFSEKEMEIIKESGSKFGFYENKTNYILRHMEGKLKYIIIIVSALIVSFVWPVILCMLIYSYNAIKNNG